MFYLLSSLACRSATTGDTGDTVTGGEATDAPDTTTHSGFVWNPHSGPGHTAAHTAEPPNPTCEGPPPPGPFVVRDTTIIHTEEDFDFDDSVYLLTQSGSSLAGVTRTGQQTILVPQIGVDAAGIRSLPNGDILVAQPDTGVIRRVDHQTGGSVAVLSSLAFPNGLEVASDGRAYVSEFVADGRVREFNPVSGDNRILLEIAYPNNMVLSPDEDVLYILVSTSQFWGSSRVVALDRRTDGTWERTPRQIMSSSTFLGGIAVDVCGNLYVTEYTSGRVGRILMPDQTVELVADLGSIGYNGGFSAARFAPGLGGWSPTELYVTNRGALFTIDLQIEGRHVLK